MKIRLAKKEEFIMKPSKQPTKIINPELKEH